MAFDPITGPDYARLKSWANNSAFQQDYNAVYQTLIGLMDGLKKFQDLVSTNFNNSVFNDDLQAILNTFTATKLVEGVTATDPVDFELEDYCTAPGGLVIFKDVSGNAGSNNITLIGSVEGVTNPVINTNFGTYKVYKSATDGLFHTW